MGTWTQRKPSWIINNLYQGVIQIYFINILWLRGEGWRLPVWMIFVYLYNLIIKFQYEDKGGWGRVGRFLAS